MQVVVIFLFISASLKAQDSLSNPFYIALKPGYGFIIPHSEAIKDISFTNPFSIEIESGWHLLRKKDWKRYNCYSRAGFSLLYSNYQYPEVLGSSLNLITFAEPFINYRGKLKSSIRMGFGASYLSQVFDTEKNPENKFFSSPLSFIVHVDYNLIRYINNKWFVSAYFKYNHISNGGISKPNKGMNFPTYGIGAGYSFEPVKFKKREKQKLQKPNPFIFSIHAFGTMAEVNDSDYEGRKPSVGAGVKVRKHVSIVNAFNASIEGVFDFGVKELMNDEPDPRDYKQFSFLVGHDFVISDFTFSQYFGTYLYAPYYLNRNFFQRYSLTYQVLPKFHVGVTLKAHAQVAENFNLMLSYDL
ncbi:MAG: acyloxyacyl hydrolase [Bacteroidales bacterium]|nr:acyloxyacyl hydrolase [Bacteroidales bacterium]